MHTHCNLHTYCSHWSAQYYMYIYFSTLYHWLYWFLTSFFRQCSEITGEQNCVQRLGMGLLVESLYALSCLHTAIPVPSFLALPPPYLSIFLENLHFFVCFIVVREGGYCSHNFCITLLKSIYHQKTTLYL